MQQMAAATAFTRPEVEIAAVLLRQRALQRRQQ